MDVPARLDLTGDQVSAAKQAWPDVQPESPAGAMAILQSEVLGARTAWLGAVDDGEPAGRTQALFQAYIALVAREGVMAEVRTQREA